MPGYERTIVVDNPAAANERAAAPESPRSATEVPKPEWFTLYLNARRNQHRSPHTLKAIESDFVVIGKIITAGHSLDTLELSALTADSLVAAFGAYAGQHSANSFLRCWSTWNTMLVWLSKRGHFTGTNPMYMVDRPKSPHSVTRSVPQTDIEKVLEATGAVNDPPRSWPEMERALIVTAMLTGVRSAELLHINVDDIRLDSTGAILWVLGKGRKPRQIPLEAPAIAEINTYLESRALLFGHPNLRSDEPPLRRYPTGTPLFVGADGERLTRGALEYRIRRAFRRADVRPSEGALLHSLRHSFAQGLADREVGTYRLRRLLGHEHLNTTERYLEGAGADLREAAAANPFYGLLNPTDSTQEKDS
ncbi:tyrosine-type recombinase/integrase [Gordonia sihwensis]|uniref:tyrosine-type recombinase/integrase n=1 Tax=Gordonia sihwensis TaxID=173559 RepID=UPI0006961BE7|nr:tyrosine-type recombinase/integrase [Gordonia sihwensis]